VSRQKASLDNTASANTNRDTVLSTKFHSDPQTFFNFFNSKPSFDKNSNNAPHSKQILNARNLAELVSLERIIIVILATP